jgi:hypothetical protein
MAFESKRRKGKAGGNAYRRHFRYTKGLVTEEIELLKAVLHLVVSRGGEEEEVVQNGKKKEEKADG